MFFDYNPLSRLVSESRYFSDLPSVPFPNNRYTLTYTYTLGGQLKSYTDPAGRNIEYAADRVGRLSEVKGTFSYNYFGDSRLKEKDDQLDDKWDRSMKHDFAGRLKFNQFGMGLGSDGNSMKRVYEQTIGYDAFSNMSSRTGLHWDESIYYSESFSNGRIANNPGLIYDAAGNLAEITSADPWSFTLNTIDAAGRRTGSFTSTKGRAGSYLNWVSQNKSEQVYDGDGRAVYESRGTRGFPMTQPPSGDITMTPTYYQIWSTELGNRLGTVTTAGTKQGTLVYAGGAAIAGQGRSVVNGQNHDSISWTTADPMTGTRAGFHFPHNSGGGSGSTLTQQEPLGQLVSLNDPAALPDPTGNQTYLGYASDPAWQCAAGRDFYGGFSAMPFHCQLKMIMDLRNTLEDIYEPERTPNDPKAVPRDIVDSPIPAEYSPDQGNSYASKAMMSVALISTSKPDKKKKGKTVKGGELAYIEVRAGSDMIDMSDSGVTSPAIAKVDSSLVEIDPRDDLKSFLSTSKNCAGLLAVLLHMEGRPVDAGDQKFVIATTGSQALNQTLTELGVIAGSKITLQEWKRPGALAETLNGTIYVYDDYFNHPKYSSTSHARGAVMFHEILHSIFKEGHIAMGRRFGIEEPSLPSAPANYMPYNALRDLAWEKEYRENNPQLFSDDAASARLQNWIDNDCRR